MSGILDIRDGMVDIRFVQFDDEEMIYHTNGYIHIVNTDHTYDRPICKVSELDTFISALNKVVTLKESDGVLGSYD